MEILRFDESDAPAPKRKSASKGWLALGLVATLMGVGTAFASSTITIPTVSLGQGVAQVTNCDGSVSVSPEATGSVSQDGETPVFRTTSIGISDIANECSGVDFGVQVFKKYNNSETLGDDYQNPNVRHDGYDISSIACAYLHENIESLSTDPALPVKCDTGTNTIWVHLPSGISDNAYAFKILLDATNDIDYVTLVSSAHNILRF